MTNIIPSKSGARHGAPLLCISAFTNVKIRRKTVGFLDDVQLLQVGDETIPACLQLLIDQRKQIGATLHRLAYKIE